MVLIRELQLTMGEYVSLKMPVYSGNLCSIRDVAAMVVNDVLSVSHDEILTARRERYKYERYKYVVVVSNEAKDITSKNNFSKQTNVPYSL